jgi:hypothetical protein
VVPISRTYIIKEEEYEEEDEKDEDFIKGKKRIKTLLKERGQRLY